LRERLVLARDLLDGDTPALALAARADDPAATALTRTLLREALAHTPMATLRRRLRVAVQQMDLAPILTIHGFCQRALTEHALEAGQPLAPRELVLNEKALLREIAEDFWRRHSLAPADADALQATWSSPKALAEALPGLM
jgi:exodeoxyribonuclease V beta subunit